MAEETSESLKLWYKICPEVPSSSKFVPQPDMANFSTLYKCFPPPSNKYYKLTTDCRDPKFVHDYRTFALQKHEVEVEHRGQNQQTMEHPRYKLNAEACANTISWDKYDFDIATCESNGPIYTAEQAHEDFIKMVNDGTQFEHCKVCDKNHILPGPPLTLPERDICGSQLPRWFPRGRYSRPWDVYLDMDEQIKECESCVTNLKILADKRFHRADERWADIGKEEGGWWACREGDNAIQAELDCRVCLTPRSKAEVDSDVAEQLRNNPSKLASLKAWKEKKYQEMVVRDKAIALAMIRNGPPAQSMLTPVPAEPVPPLRIPYDSSDDEGDWTTGPYGGQIPWTGRRKSKKPVIDENQRGSGSPKLKPMELHHEMSALNLDQLTAGLDVQDEGSPVRSSAASSPLRMRRRGNTVTDPLDVADDKVERGRSLTREPFSSTASAPSNKFFMR